MSNLRSVIIQSRSDWGCKLRLISCLAIGGALISTLWNCAFAQTTPDATLGASGSVVTPNVVINGIVIDRIDGGAIRGINLFHSFLEFNVGEGKGVYFSNPTGIENILSRVTGANPSNILGKLGVLGNANLFLINPQGIIFGPNASLDVGSSFVATTANAVQFDNQGFFSATAPFVPPLLTVNPSALLFNQIASGRIKTQSIAPAGLAPSGLDTFGLRVPDGRSLLLVGGDISVDGLGFRDVATENSGGLKAFGGRIELGGLAAPGNIGLNVNGNELRLSFPEGVARRDVSLTNNAEVNVRAGGGGDIAINTRNLDTSEGSSLLAGIESGNGSSSSRAGDITLNATEGITVTGIVAAEPEQSTRVRNNVLFGAIGDSGDIIIQTGAIAITDNGRLSASTFGEGNAGSVSVQATGPFSLSNSIVSSGVDSEAIGNGGVINIEAGTLSLTDGARLVTTTFGQGNAGNVSVRTNDLVSLTGRKTNIFSTVEAGAVGNGGNITINAGALSLRDGAQLQTQIQGSWDTIPGGEGNAGNVSIDVRDTVTLAGVNTNDDGLISSAILSSVGSGAIGKGGDINIKTGSLSMMDSAQLITATLGQGNAGDVSVQANDLVSLTGKNTALFSTVEPGAVGNGGNINIRVGSLSVTDGAQLLTLIRGPSETIPGAQGNAGSVFVQANDLVSLTGRDTTIFSRVEAGTVGDGGNITIRSRSFSLTDGAELVSNTLGPGNAGNIQINSSDSVSISGTNFSSGNPSGLFTNTNSTGSGGKIEIDTNTFRIWDRAILNAQTTADGESGSIIVKANTFNATNGGQILTTTAGSKRAGDIILNLTDSLTLTGSDSGLFANTTRGSTGNGGNIFIDPNVTISDGARIAVNSQGQGDAGRIQIQGGSLTLDNKAFISAETASGRGGNITLQLQDLLLLRRGSNISTTAGTARAGGNGGDITIDTDLLVALENSDIRANAFEGEGGNIQINTLGIFLSPNSEITASSEFGVDGVVEINTPDVDPSRGLVNLPTQPTDTEVIQACQPGGSQEQSDFVVTGRGGLPPTPHEALSSDAIVVDWVTLNSRGENLFSPAVSTNPTAPEPAPIVEAQGWAIAPNGEVILTASTPNVTPHSPWRMPASCRAAKSIE